MEITVLIRHLLFALVLAGSTASYGQTIGLTTDVPDCQMPAGKVLPHKYYMLAKTYKEYRWVLKVVPGARVVSAKGLERANGSSMFDWLTLYRIDLNNDGLCDWFVDASAPISTGGDRDSIDTLYLGVADGWERVGFTGPIDKPDELGFGKSVAEQSSFLFGEEIAVVHDATSKTNYIVTAFHDRHVQLYGSPGYRVLVWDAGKRTLRLLDKWEPRSKAAEVYAFFKSHGAREPSDERVAPGEGIARFLPDIEEKELDKACDPETQRSSLYAVPSRHLLARCKR
jgi:hypothetical protein